MRQTHIFADLSSAILRTNDPVRRSGAKNPTGARIHGGSLEAGTFEHRFWRKLPANVTNALCRQAKELSVVIWHQRAPLRARGPDRIADPAKTVDPFGFRLSKTALIIFEYFCDFARTTGEIFCSYDKLSRKLGIGRSTAIRAVKQLVASGFVEKMMRFTRTEREGPGPRYEQTSNAYRINQPERLTEWLGHKIKPLPLPDDEQMRRRAAAIDGLAMERQQARLARASEGKGPLQAEIDRLTPADRELIERASDPATRATLTRMALSFDNERESHLETEPLSKSIIFKGGDAERP